MNEEAGSDIEEAPIIDDRDNSDEGKHRRAIFSVQVDVVVSVGQARPVIGELLAMRRDMVLPLSTRVDDPVQIMVGDRIIARGELEEMGDETGRLGVRLTEVVDVTDLF
ncbi:MAG: FliM/FliN family flagellar motor C-terminal domain-containing protein [Pseudomonadota bacterium]